MKRILWHNRSKFGKAVVIAVAGFTSIGVISSLAGTDETKTPTANAAAVATSSGSSAEKAPAITKKVAGYFHRDCLLCDRQMVSYITTSNAWCGWRDGKVLVHVTMRNTSVEHVTVDWHPSYVIARGGEHGAGLTAMESSGFDAGEIRQLISEQEPEGVPAGSRIAECKPSFSDVSSG